MVANRFLYGIDVLYGSERINFDARRCNRSIVRGTVDSLVDSLGYPHLTTVS